MLLCSCSEQLSQHSCNASASHAPPALTPRCCPGTPHRIGLSRPNATSPYTWLLDDSSAGDTVADGSASPHWAWPQPQLAASPGHHCVAAWSAYQYDRFLGNASVAAQVSGATTGQQQHPYLPAEGAA